MTDTITITAHAIHPSADQCARVTRAPAASYLRPIGDPWPTLSVGQEIIVITQGWQWSIRVLDIVDADTVRAQVLSPRVASPFPPIVDDRIVLPNFSGHAHARRWRRGDVVEVHGQAYRVTHQPRPVDRAHTAIEYRVTPVDAAAKATRPGRVNLQSEHAARKAVGSAVRVGDEWLHIERVERRAYGDAEGAETFGHIYTGVGHYVTTQKAERLNVAHRAARDAAEWGGPEGLRARDGYDAAVTAIPADYERRHGATLGGDWRIGADRGTEPAVGAPTDGIADAIIEWREVARKHRPGIHGSGETWVLHQADTRYGALYRERQSSYGDERTTIWAPREVYIWMLRQEIARLGITPEAAREWLTQYRGCVGTELYEFAASGRVG